MKKRFLTIAMALFMVLGLAACSSDTPASSEDPVTTGSTSANAEKPLVWFNRQPSNSSTG